MPRMRCWREVIEDLEKSLTRRAVLLPSGLGRVHEIDNSGALSDTVALVQAVLQPESA